MKKQRPTPCSCQPEKEGLEHLLRQVPSVEAQKIKAHKSGQTAASVVASAFFMKRP
jgi:hypothetical protein